MNPRTLGIYATAAALSAAALFLVIKGGSPQTPPQVPPTTPPIAPPPSALQPQASVRFGRTVIAHAQISQSHLLSQSQADIFLNVEIEASQGSGGRSPIAAALVIDRSGSMAGVKIDNARDAALAFLRRLRDNDRLAIISYGSDVTTNVRLGRVGDIRATAQRRILSIDAGGGTNIAAGLRSAISELRAASGARRVLLISDGRPTEGRERSPGQLATIAGNGRRTGIAFSSIGVGLDYDENVMERIALRGGGGFYHLRRASTLAGILRREFESMETMVASAVQLRVDPGPGVQLREVFGYAIRREGTATIIDIGDLAGGEKRRLVARVLVNTGAPALHSFASLALSYRSPAQGKGESAAAALSYASTSDVALAQNSQDANATVSAYKAEAAAAVRSSMEAMGKRDRAGAIKTLRRAKKRLAKAAARAPAAAAPMMRQQAAAFDAIELKTQGISVESEAGKDYIKNQRASSFAAQRAY